MASPRILVTRAANGNSELAEHLRALGAEPILIPAIALAEPTSFDALDAAFADLGHFHWLLFTSVNGVEAFANRRTNQPAPATAPGVLKVAAIGPATARALEKIGLPPDLLPQKAVAESLLEALLPLARQPDDAATRFLLIRAEEARELLPETLRAAGAEVTVAPAYRNVVPAASIAQLQTLFADVRDPVAAITFTSASTARNLVLLCEQAGVTLPCGALRISIGPITSATLQELGLPAHAEAPEATVQALAETVLHAVAQEQLRMG